MSRRPAFVTETNEPPPWTDCAWASLAMLIEKSTGKQVNREQLRRISGDRYGGSNHDDLERAYTALGVPIRRLRLGWEKFVDELARGCGASVAGNMHNVPSNLKRWDPGFGARSNAWHEVYVQDADRSRNRVWWMDPLGRPPYAGEWVSLDALWTFTSPLFKAYGYVPALLSPRPTPAKSAARHGDTMIALVAGDVSTSRNYRLRRGAVIFRSPDGARVNTLDRETVVPAIGNVDGSSAWRAAVFNTAAYSDRVSRPTILYVRGSDVLALEDAE